MDIFLQAWGGILYLLNKVFLAVAESKENDKIYRICGWLAMLIGMPAWMIILGLKHDWIVVSIEIGGVPSIILGLAVALRGIEKTPKWISIGSSINVYVFLVLGLGYSIYDFGGINAISQVLELGVIIGFLLGSYMLARKSSYGWLWFMLMNGSCGILMLIQGKPVLALQQAISLGFVVYGFIKAFKKKKEV